jgi:hypothetical protein
MKPRVKESPIARISAPLVVDSTESKEAVSIAGHVRTHEANNRNDVSNCMRLVIIHNFGDLDD